MMRPGYRRVSTRMAPMAQDRSHWSVWVKVGLWGLSHRFAALGFVWLSVAVAAACAVAMFYWWPAIFGVGMVPAALWYYLAMRWVDDHGGWYPARAPHT